MDSKPCEVYVDERDGEVSIRFRGQTKTIVKENGYLKPNIGEELYYKFQEFESQEDMNIWTACILAEAAQIKFSHLNEAVRSQKQYITFRGNKQPIGEAVVPLKIIPIKHKHYESQSAGNASSDSLEAQFQHQRRQFSKFNSLVDRRVAQDLVTTFEDMLKKQALKIDMVAAQPQPTFVNAFRQNLEIDPLDPDQIIAAPEEVPPNAIKAALALLAGLSGQETSQIDFYAEEPSEEQVIEARQRARAATDLVTRRKPPKHNSPPAQPMLVLTKFAQT
ncbi:MAG: hypothetical protein EZS28_019925 [Streblomastix strix]|uniref:Uncharacterized protein n=1 Tax=Streblomastix strix TaxID=222440 RepID=A0A5J4VPH3_9EUKA|nr:MAG: hypothetical protein EZS28_019925 [Streblomastix strix]